MNLRVNYLKFIPRDWAWYDAYKSAMGAEALLTFVNKVYRFLTEMKPGSYFKIDGGVKPENADLFIMDFLT
jgi:hypothetical protein